MTSRRGCLPSTPEFLGFFIYSTPVYSPILSATPQRSICSQIKNDLTTVTGEALKYANVAYELIRSGSAGQTVIKVRWRHLSNASVQLFLGVCIRVTLSQSELLVAGSGTRVSNSSVTR